MCKVKGCVTSAWSNIFIAYMGCYHSELHTYTSRTCITCGDICASHNYKGIMDGDHDLEKSLGILELGTEGI